MKKRLVALGCLLALPAVSVHAQTQSSHPPASAAAVNEQLSKALVCRGDSLGIVRALPGKKKELATLGIDVRPNDEEGEDEVIEVLLREPLQLEGATADKVTLSFGSPYPGFSGLVFAEFKGDPQAVIRGLKLIKGSAARYPIAPYVSRAATRAGCPPHVGLSVLGKDRFVLGCGWCNGG